jgi:hypothetical protein
MAILPPVPYDRPQTSYEWVDWYTKLRKVIDESALNHNDLVGLQGGSSTERFHLTNAQVAQVTGAQQTSQKDAPSGYAGLNASSRVTKGVDTPNDLIVDLATRGLVLKDTQGTPHYWRVTISNLGVLQTTDLGTTKP